MDPVGMFLRDLKRRNKRPLTIAKWGKILRDAGRSFGLLNATRDDIENWLDAKGELAASSRAAYITCLNSFYRFMLDEEIMVGQNPCLKVARPTVRRGLPRPISEKDLAVALKWAPPRERCWLALAAFAGLRCCEIAGLAVADLVWSEDGETPGMIRVVAENGKGGKERMIPMHLLVERALKDYGVPKEGPFFRNARGRKVEAWQVSNKGSEFLHSAGIPCTMHQLRHRFASNVYRGAGLLPTQRLLGHASPTTTAIYAHVAVEDLRGAVASLEDPSA